VRPPARVASIVLLTIPTQVAPVTLLTATADTVKEATSRMPSRARRTTNAWAPPNTRDRDRAIHRPAIAKEIAGPWSLLSTSAKRVIARPVAPITLTAARPDTVENISRSLRARMTRATRHVAPTRLAAITRSATRAIANPMVSITWAAARPDRVTSIGHSLSTRVGTPTSHVAAARLLTSNLPASRPDTVEAIKSSPRSVISQATKLLAPKWMASTI
jgi:hypothetical protein